MLGNSEESRSEPQEIIILTLAMTAVGFLLLYLMLQYYLIPDLKSQVGQELSLIHI